MFLNIFIDLIILVILYIGSDYGYSRGLFKLVAAPGQILLSTFLSFSFSEVSGEKIIAPFVFSRFEENTIGFIDPLVNVLSFAIAFVVLFLASKILIKFLIYVLSGFLEKGFFGKINCAFGCLLTGVISIIVAMFFSSLIEFLSVSDILFTDFFGGPIFRLLAEISPFKMIFSNF